MVKGQRGATWKKEHWNHSRTNYTWIKAYILIIKDNEISSKRWHVLLLLKNEDSFAQGSISSYDSEYGSIKKKDKFNYVWQHTKNKVKRQKKWQTKGNVWNSLITDKRISFLMCKELLAINEGRRLWRQFQLKEIWIALKHKMPHSSLIFREIQIKPPTRYCTLLIRSAKMNLDTLKPWWNTDNQDTDRNNLLSEVLWKHLSTVQVQLPWHPITPLLKICPIYSPVWKVICTQHLVQVCYPEGTGYINYSASIQRILCSFQKKEAVLQKRIQKNLLHSWERRRCRTVWILLRKKKERS